MVDDDNLVIDEELQAQIDKARQAGDAVSESEPYALNAWYDSFAGLIYVELNNGIVAGFPTKLLQGLETATREQLDEVELTSTGYGLHWEELDVDLSVPQLISGCYGTKQWMQNLDRAGNLAPSKQSNVSAEKFLHRNPKVYGQVIEQPTLTKITIEILKNTSLLTWITIPALLYGGGIFIVYFASIGYMPELKIQDALHQLYTSAITGFFIFSLISILVMLPGLSYKNSVFSKKYKFRTNHKSYGFIRLSVAELCLILGFSAIFSLPVSFVQKTASGSIYVAVAIFFLGILMVFLGFFLVRNTMKKQSKIDDVEPFSWKNNLLWSSILFESRVIPVSLTIFFSYSLIGSDSLLELSRNSILSWLYLISIPIIVIIGNKFALEISPENGFSRYSFFVLFGLTTVFVIQFFFGSTSFLSARIVQIYGWGNIQDATLVLNRNGCEIVESLGLAVTPNRIGSDQSQICQIEKVEILSRIGEKYFLRVDLKNNRIREFEIPTSMIHSWSIVKPAEKTK